ncbi:MAG: carboxypeptidase-like regulatory domain-containing protein [Gemmatimonadota bacterium]
MLPGRSAALRRCGVAAVSLFLLAVGPRAASLGAQTIRGTVVDEDSKLPIASVRISMLDDTGKETLPDTRSDSLGNFTIHASRAGTWRVQAQRIGYSPNTSDPVDLGIGGLAVVRLRMTTVAQKLVPVLVVERRQLSASELMSTAGFDLRESRGLGKFLSGERLAAMGTDGVGEILRSQFQPVLFVFSDPVLGDVLRIRQGSATCAPEIFLDGRLLATAPKPRAIVDGARPVTRLDSLRADMRLDADSSRVGFDQNYAAGLLASLRAAELHGIEVYRAYEVPPASLGAWFGMTKTAIRSCGTVAVWTKAGARSVVTARSVTTPGRAVQVVMGTLQDNETGVPLAGRPVFLLSAAGEQIGSPVLTDERGDFTMRTGRAGEVKLTAGGDGYLQSTTPAFNVTANELVLVKLFVSARQGVLAPLAVAARVLPQNVGPSSIAGFTYRRERAQGGTFLRVSDIERTGAATLADVLRTVSGVSVVDTPTPGTIVVGGTGSGAGSSAGRCTPMYVVDGSAASGNARTTMPSVPLERIFGIEVYTNAAEIPAAFTDTAACGLIVIWTRR